MLLKMQIDNHLALQREQHSQVRSWWITVKIVRFHGSERKTDSVSKQKEEPLWTYNINSQY